MEVVAPQYETGVFYGKFPLCRNLSDLSEAAPRAADGYTPPVTFQNPQGDTTPRTPPPTATVPMTPPGWSSTDGETGASEPPSEEDTITPKRVTSQVIPRRLALDAQSNEDTSSARSPPLRRSTRIQDLLT